MEKEIKLEKKNSEGKIIIKKVPESIAPFYINIGWEFPRKLSEKIDNKSKKNSEEK